MEIFWWIKPKSKSTISAESIKKAVVTKMRIFRRETFVFCARNGKQTPQPWRFYFTKLGFGSSNFAFFFFLTSFRCWISSASKLVVSSCGKLLVLRNVCFGGSFDSIKLSISKYSRSYKTNDHWLTFISRRLWCSFQNLSIEYDINEYNENVNLDHNSVPNELNKPIYQSNLQACYLLCKYLLWDTELIVPFNFTNSFLSLIGWTIWTIFVKDNKMQLHKNLATRNHLIWFTVIWVVMDFLSME